MPSAKPAKRSPTEALGAVGSRAARDGSRIQGGQGAQTVLSGHSRQLGADVLLFVGIAAATFLLVFISGLFDRGGSALTPADRLRALGSVATGTGAASSSAGLPDVSAGVEDSDGRAYAETAYRAAGESFYRVQPGDTLSDIARAYEVEVATLVAHNAIADPDRIVRGQTLAIPRFEPDVEIDPEAASDTGITATVRGLLQSLRNAPAAETRVAEDRALEALLALAEEELRGARFDEAEHSAKAAERVLEVRPEDAKTGGYVARLELIRATVQLAFGDVDDARGSLERVLEAEPELTLDPDATPRKVLALMETVRETRTARVESAGP